MRITGPEIPPNSKIIPRGTEKTGDSPKTGIGPDKTSGNETLITRLGRIFSGHSIKVTQPQITALASELALLNVSPETLDETTAFRALLLIRNNVPPARELLFPDNKRQPVLLNEIMSLVAEAESLLAEGGLTGEIRAATDRFVRNMSALFQFDEAFDPAVADSAKISSLLLKNGLSFEWRLLAWYRAGRDPMILRGLIEDDLKGILIDFLNRLRKKGSWKRTGGKRLETLEKSVDSALKTLTNRQLTTLLETQYGRKGFLFDFPFGKSPGAGSASVVAEGKRENGSSGGLSPDDFTLSFEVLTTNLGTVTAFMAVSGKAVSLRFELEDGSAVTLGESMADEVREGLRRQGYAVGDVAFCERIRTPETPRQSPESAGSVDIKT